LVLLIVVLAAATPRLRQLMRWRLPAFREASLAQVASALAIMLKSGVSMDKALSLMVKLERGSPAGTEFARWHQRLAAGQTSFSEIASGRKFFPALFIWTVSQAHEDVPGGFQHTAETYQARALYRTEALLYAVLPCSVLALGMVIIAQLQPVLAMFGSFFGQIEN
jgi:type II secretory pathway component PulF